MPPLLLSAHGTCVDTKRCWRWEIVIVITIALKAIGACMDAQAQAWRERHHRSHFHQQASIDERLRLAMQPSKARIGL